MFHRFGLAHCTSGLLDKGFDQGALHSSPMLHSVSHSDTGISRSVSSSSAQMPGIGWKGRNTFITPCTPPDSSLIPQAYLLQACPYSQNTFLLQRSSLSTVLSLWICPATPPPIALSHPIWARFPSSSKLFIYSPLLF